MSHLTSTSVKEIIARVIRNAGYKVPSMYLDDMLEWIPEAMDQLETKHTLITKSTPNEGETGAIVTKNHVAKLPCGLVEILAVESEYGTRLYTGSDITDITNQSTRYHNDTDNARNFSRDTDFQVDPTLHNSLLGSELENTPAPSVPFKGEDIVPDEGEQLEDYYKIQFDTIQTSRESMFVKIHYLSLPVDNEGYPLVPNNENYKTALYWYVMKQLIGAGYEHKVFNYQYCDDQFEKFASRALGEIKMPNEDRIAKLHRSFSSRLIPPYHYYEDFSIGQEQTQRIIKDI